MTLDPQRAKSVFLAALSHGAAGRGAFLDETCAGDADLRRRVDRLLAAHALPDSVPEAADLPATATAPEARPGFVVDSYRLVEEIGEGGMGTVWLAQQQQPVRRLVAVKLVKAGMDSKQVLARFEAERQALALMDHANIARVLDGGTTASGRPYFVMDLVKGVPITRYCDEHRLTPRQRLELFIPVCQAVQHAHQKGIIHRDLKPSNVLVASYDGKPVPKVIDFGVAKAAGQPLTEETLVTGFGAIVGTLEYMSPEQAEVNQLDVDTRSDVYSLGVLLYELLTGTTPFTRKDLEKGGMLEMLRVIREQEPTRPSTKLSTAEALPTLAANRGTEPGKLSQLVRGELDWIAMKALEKDRNRRYETANGLAADVQRHLKDEPVLACPASVLYRCGKLVRRNKVAVAAASALGLALLLGVAGLAVSNRLIARERDDKETARAEADRQRKRAEENYRTAREAVDRLFTRAADELRDKPHVEQIRRALLEDALRFYQGFLKERSEEPNVRYETALAFRRVGEIHGLLGDWEKGLENCRHSTGILGALVKQAPGNTDYRDQLARGHFHLARAFFGLLRRAEGIKAMEEAIAIWAALAKGSPSRPSYLEDLAYANVTLGNRLRRDHHFFAKGDPYIARSNEIVAQLDKSFPNYQINSGLLYERKEAQAWRFRHLPQDATMLKQLERESRDELARSEKTADAHPDVLDHQARLGDWMYRLGNVLQAMNRFQEVEELTARQLEFRKGLVQRFPQDSTHRLKLGWAHYNHGLLLHWTDRPGQAVDHFRVALELAKAVVAQHPDNLKFHTHLAGMLVYCPATQFRDAARAIEAEKRALQLGGDAWVNLALAQCQARQFEEALESCEKGAAAGNWPGEIALAKATAYWRLGKQKQARQVYQQTMRAMDGKPNGFWWSLQYRCYRRELEKLMGIEKEQQMSSGPASKKPAQEETPKKRSERK